MSVSNVHPSPNPSHDQSPDDVQVQLALSAQDFARAQQFAQAKQLPVEVYLQERIVDDLDQTKQERLAKFQEAVESLHATILEDKKHWTEADWEKEWQNMQRIAKEVRREQHALYLKNYPEMLARHSEIQEIEQAKAMMADKSAHQRQVYGLKKLRDIFTEVGVTEEEMLEALDDVRREAIKH